MKNRKHARRVKRLALICTLCTIILVVSTYAWFIGMRTVNVSSFDVEIAATEGLTLSLDGITWGETVTINQSNYDNDTTYAENTNTWGGVGLVPVSTIGQIDLESSRLILYEKGSLTTTTGGYRLMASRVVNNDKTKEVALGGTKTGAGDAGEEGMFAINGETVKKGSGYVAFDLFVRNLSGNEYYTDFNPLNEEAVYLTRESKVVVDKSMGADQDKTGIENSVRVAFAQIGRIKAVRGATTTEAGAKAQTITCNNGKEGTAYYDATNGITGSCTKGAQIWEPNDTAHVKNAIEWYEASCKKRTGTVGQDFTYDSSAACKTLVNGTYSNTYAIGSVINYTDYVDVYDGEDYNTFTGNTNAGSNGKPLHAVDYFTDTEKMYTGMQREPFFHLAPNSITKVRVYIYLEGQDVDNYDFASLGKKIKVNFGFTKERFFSEDIGYDGPTSVSGETVDGVPTDTIVPSRTGEANS